jgi:hypothetical protein
LELIAPTAPAGRLHRCTGVRCNAWLDIAAALRTHLPAVMISSSEARQRVQENLTGFPSSVVDAYLAFADAGDLARLDDVVLGVLQFYLAKPPGVPLTTMPGSTRLVADLGCDSLTMIDVMFLAEALLGIKLADDELTKIETLDQLRAHFRGRITEADKTAA